VAKGELRAETSKAKRAVSLKTGGIWSPSNGHHGNNGSIATIDTGARCECAARGSDARRVWIDDRNVIFRRGMHNCLTGAGFVIAGESSALTPAPDLVDVDALIFEVDETAIRRAAAVAGTTTRLVGVASTPHEEMLFDALEAGLAGFLVRSDITPDGLLGCLAAVTNGAGSLPAELLTRLVDRLAEIDGRGTIPGRLANREVKVLRLLAEGGNTREIADLLSYSERTVKNIVHDVLMKMNCRTRAHAVATATRQGVI
jgi:DNA-binding NarL/FixJ family response regulator